MIDFRPDVIHAHDWHTAAIPVLLNTAYRSDSHVGHAASLLTIHNIQHQGSFYEGVMDVLGVGWEHYNFLELEKDNQVNLLKGGMYHATLLNTVSRGYVREMRTPEYGWRGLSGTEPQTCTASSMGSTTMNGIPGRTRSFPPTTPGRIAAASFSANAPYRKPWVFPNGTIYR